MSIKKSIHTSSKVKKQKHSSRRYFPRKINLATFIVLILVILLVSVFVKNKHEQAQIEPYAVPGSYQNGDPSVRPGSTDPVRTPTPAGTKTPPFFCLGTCPTTAPDSRYGGPMKAPTGTNSNNPVRPTTAQPTTQPNETPPGNSTPRPNQPNENNQSLLDRILQLLNQLFDLLRQLLGGGGGNNGGGNDPVPSTAVPSTNPNQPSTVPSTTVPSGTTGDTTPPNSPTNLRATVVNENRIDLTWTGTTDNSGGTGIREYMVYRSEGDASTGGNSGINYQVSAGTNTRFSDTNGLRPSTQYYYYIRAIDRAGNRGGNSNTAGAKTKAKIPAKNKITGKVALSPKKDVNIKIELYKADSSYKPVGNPIDTESRAKEYTFSNIANGKYHVRISYGQYDSGTCNIEFKSTAGNETKTCSKTLKL